MTRVCFLGDTVGSPGRAAAARAAKWARDEHHAHLVLANAENARHGSGLHPPGYAELRRAGIDGVSLGDHWARDGSIFRTLDDPDEPISRPANLADDARGKRWYAAHHDGATVALLTVLGRLFMSVPANDPFATIDRLVPEIISAHPDACVIVEVHAEATSEKIAISWHCARKWGGRVVAVLGTHTHVQTSDARIVEHAHAAVTDVGMCGGRRGVLGRQIDPVLRFMTTQNPAAFDVATEDVRACGAIIDVDPERRIATAVRTFDIPTP